jgi:tRNA (cmo5U34)-methyltransferase
VAEPQEVWFVDVSSAMMEKARAFWQAELAGAPTRLHFLQGTQADLPEGLQVEVVITPFFLDLFSPTELESLFHKLDAHLLPGGHWYLSDFRIPMVFFVCLPAS